MQRKTLYSTVGETIKHSEQWAAECEKRGTSISSVAWEMTGGTVTEGATTGTVTYATVVPTGDGTLTCTVTLANGDVLIVQRLIRT
jgi:hypothetical protein